MRRLSSGSDYKQSKVLDSPTLLIVASFVAITSYVAEASFVVASSAVDPLFTIMASFPWAAQTSGPTLAFAVKPLASTFLVGPFLASDPLAFGSFPAY